MTMITEGEIDGRPIAIRRDEKTGVTRAFICTACMQETKPERRAFAKHSCESPQKRSKGTRKTAAASTPDEVSDEAQ